MRIAALLGIVCVCSPSLCLFAEDVSLDTFDFTLLAENRIVVGPRSEVIGSIGASDAVTLGRDSEIEGDVYAGDGLSNARFVVTPRSEITGRAVANGDTIVGAHARVGSLATNGSIRLAANAIVSNEIAHGAGQRFVAHRTAVAAEPTIHSDIWVAPAFPEMNTTPDDGLGTQGKSFTVFRRGPIGTLSAGSHGTVRIGAGATVLLTAGTYNIENLILGSRGSILVDTSQGAVTINIGNKLRTAGGVDIKNIGDDQVTINVENRVRIGNNNDIEANIIAYHNLVIGSNSELEGYFYSKRNVFLRRGVDIRGPDGSNRPVIPEPGSLLLLTGGAYWLRHRRQIV